MRTAPKRADRQRTACSDAIERLRSMGNPRNVEGMARYGIRPKRAFGVSAPDLRRLAKEIGRDHPLAQRLWATGIHDAKHLAAYVAEPEKVTPREMDRWARGFDSWDMVDGTCCHLFVYTPHAWDKAAEWAQRQEEYVRRAAFSLLAYLAVHDKTAPDGEFRRFFPLIREASMDERNAVKKAVNWALRQIGKRNSRLNRLAIREAGDIAALESRAARWIASDALRELRSQPVQDRLCRKDSGKGSRLSS